MWYHWAGGALALLGAAAALAWRAFRAPTYVPGAVAAKAASLVAARRVDAEHYDVGDGVSVKVASVGGRGRDGAAGAAAAAATPLHVICVHGGPGAPWPAPWAFLDEALGDRATFHFMDARGCGGSSRPVQRWPSSGFYPGCRDVEARLGLGEQVADIERLRLALVGAAGRVVIVGHSFGGFVATLYAAEFPQHVAGLVLLAPASVLQLPPPAGAFDMFTAVRERLGSDEHRAEYDDFKRRYFDYNGWARLDERGAAELQLEFALHWRRACPDMDMPAPAPGGAAALGGFLTFGSFLSMGIVHDYAPALRRRLAGAAFAVELVSGADDLVPVSEAAPYMRLFTGGTRASHRVVDNTGHWMWLQRPGAVVDAVRRVLDDAAAQRART